MHTSHLTLGSLSGAYGASTARASPVALPALSPSVIAHPALLILILLIIILSRGEGVLRVLQRLVAGALCAGKGELCLPLRLGEPLRAGASDAGLGDGVHAHGYDVCSNEETGKGREVHRSNAREVC